jgi:hypothetical protein
MQLTWVFRAIVFFLVCLAFGEASAQSTRPLYVFNDDAVCDVIDVTLTASGPVDASGRYRVVFLSPYGDTAQVCWGWQHRFQDTVIALVGWHADGSIDPIVRWEDARLLIRPGSEKCLAPWKGLPLSDKSRKARFEWPPESAWPTGTQLWGIKVPAAMRSCTCFEAFGFRRPDWQRGVCRMFEFSSTTPVEMITNRRSTDTTAETRVVGGSLAFAHSVTPHSGIARFFFAPKDAVNEGDVTVLTGPTTVAWNCSGNVTSQSLFPSVNAAKRSDGASEPVLLVGVGGQIVSPSQFSSISGSLTFPDGEQIQFQGKTLNGCYIEWPGHCDTSGVISVQGATAQTASGITVPLATTNFEIVKADKELVGPSGVRVRRLGTTCPTAPQVDFGGTASFTLPAAD